MMRFSLTNNKLAIFLAVLSIVFNMNTLPMALYFSNAQYAVITLIIYTLVGFWGCMWERKYQIDKIDKIDKRILTLFVFVSCMVALTAFINGDSSILYGVLILELYKAVVISMLLDYKQFVYIYIKTMYVLAFVSIILHFSIMVVPAIQVLGMVAYNENNIPFYSFGVYYKSLNEGFRNYGFLTEPGDYQHYLNTALLLYFFSDGEIKDRLSEKIPIVLTLAAVSTFSPAGLVYLVCVWFAYAFNTHRVEKISWKLKTAILFAIVVVCLSPTLMDILYRYTLAKLNGTSTNSRSIRLDGILVGLKYFMDKPLFGNGCTNAIANMSRDLTTKYGGADQTSTITGFLAMFGIFTTIPLVYYFFKCLMMKYAIKPSIVSMLFIFAGLMMTVNNERFIWEHPYYIFVVYGVSASRKKNNDKQISRAQ